MQRVSIYLRFLRNGDCFGVLVSSAWGGGVWLYESGTPGFGYRRCRAGQPWPLTLPQPAATRPVWTRLERSQMLAAFQGLYIDAPV